MELWDLYDKNRIRTGKTMYRGDSVPEGYYRMVIHIALFNSEGKMLIQRRNPDKYGWSGMWDVTVGGSAIAGETSSEAAERELAEELGVKYDLSAARPAYTLSFKGGFGDMYIINADIDTKDLVLQATEVCDARYATKDEILSMIDADEFIPYHKSMIEFLFFLREGKGAHAKPDKTLK